MNIVFQVNDRRLEFPPDANQDFCLFKLSEVVFPELSNTTEFEIQVIAQMNKHKLVVWLEKSPIAVNNGKITMRQYVLNKLNELILSMYRTREVEQGMQPTELSAFAGYKERLRNLNYQYIEEPQFYEDIEYALSLDEKVIALQKKLDTAKRYFITIGNIARKQDNPFLYEINRHVDDALDHLE